MRKLVDIVLIGFSPDAHEVGTDPVSIRNPVQAEEMSFNQYDSTEAGGTGLKPEAKILIPMPGSTRKIVDIKTYVTRDSFIRENPLLIADDHVGQRKMF